MYIRPVFRLKWNRLGVLLLRQQTYVRNMTVAVCMANCLRMSQRLSGLAIVLIMYCALALTQEAVIPHSRWSEPCPVPSSSGSPRGPPI